MREPPVEEHGRRMAARPKNPIQEMFSKHSELLEKGNHYAYFVLEWNRATSWLVLLKRHKGDVKPLVCGQAETPEEACSKALNHLAKRKHDSLSSCVKSLISRLETIKETNPEIHLDEDIELAKNTIDDF